MTAITARFVVNDWEPVSVQGVDDWVGVARLQKTFTSGLVGSSTVLFLSSGAEGSRSYLAAEQISGTTSDGRRGTLTVHHGAAEGRPGSEFGFIVPGSGTGDLSTWSGAAFIGHDDQGAFFTFDAT